MAAKATIERVSGFGMAAGALVFVVLLSGVGSGLLTNDPTGDEGYSSGPAGSLLAITAVDFGVGAVTITNSGAADASLDGLWLCNFPDYQPLTGAIAAGDTLQVEFGVAAASGEAGLYSSSSFTDSNAMVSYVEWGDGTHERSSVAVVAGVWDGIPLPGGGDGLAATTNTPGASSDWS